MYYEQSITIVLLLAATGMCSNITVADRLSIAFANANPTTDQLKQWILTNRKSMPYGTERAIASASDGDLASTILRIFGIGSATTPEVEDKPTTRKGVPPSERDGSINYKMCIYLFNNSSLSIQRRSVDSVRRIHLLQYGKRWRLSSRLSL